MTFNEYYILNKNGKSNCVIRSLCKILNKDYDDCLELYVISIYKKN